MWIYLAFVCMYVCMYVCIPSVVYTIRALLSEPDIFLSTGAGEKLSLYRTNKKKYLENAADWTSRYAGYFTTPRKLAFLLAFHKRLGVKSSIKSFQSVNCSFEYHRNRINLTSIHHKSVECVRCCIICDECVMSMLWCGWLSASSCWINK